jgi:carbon-monoxide dehydrogenase small subunit
MNTVSFLLNGKSVIYDGNVNARLLDVLRNEFHLNGVKCGCREGECGACSVIMDGMLVNSCMVAMGRVNGSSITTIEGYCKTERFKVLDSAFASVSAIQCGYCIPGMVMTSLAFVKENPNPTIEEIKEAVSGNLCRCTGYKKIIEAIYEYSAEKNGKSTTESAKTRPEKETFVL